MIESTISGYADELIALRRDFHAHPELAFQEHRTSDIVADFLNGLGYELTTGIAGTGLVGRLCTGNSGKSIGLRADMDALPILENTGLSYASKSPGKMHACGHDGHMAMLLGAARYLAETREFTGTINLIFQPAEEDIGGARAMIDDGLFDDHPCDAVFAMHNLPGVPVRRVRLQDSGAFMASADTCHVDDQAARAGMARCRI